MHYIIPNNKVLSFGRKFTEKILDFLLPRTKMAKKIAKMSAEELLKMALPSGVLPIADAKTLFAYADPLVKNAIWLLKYRQNKASIKLLGETLGYVAEEWLENLETFENFDNALLVPVPMGKNRLRERGGNHCEFLCEEMIKTMPQGTAEYGPRVLFKIRETTSQARTKNRAGRLKNLAGSFSANSRLIRGRNILLIDDVVTTGATIEEVRRTLLRAGAKKVLALAIAH